MKNRYFKILGLQPGATENEIRKNYRKLVMKYHPDKNDSPQAAKKFIEIKEAYEILTGKEEIQQVNRRQSKSTSQKNKAENKEERIKKAQKRYRDQVYQEHIENEKYFNFLTKGNKWKTIRVITVIGIILSTFLISDFFLPHHFQKVEITHFNLKPGASGVNGEVLGRIKTKNEGSFWVTRMDHDLYGKSYPTYLESSWFFHNPIKLVSIGKTKIKSYDLHFGFYNFSGLMILFLLLPLTLFFYKKKKISFTVLYHFCYYFVGILILLFVLTGYRWAHIITLGFL